MPLPELRQLLKGTLRAPVTLSLRAATLDAAVRELSRQSGLGIGITPDVRAEDIRGIDLDVRDMPARHVLDWLARLAGACYAVEGRQAVFITRDRAWASQDRVRMQSWAVGTFAYAPRPQPGRFDRTRDAEELLRVLRYCLRHTMAGNSGASLLLDETGSRLSAFLTPRGHAKLDQIIGELKRPREYEPPPPDRSAEEETALLDTPVTCNFARQDIRRIASELGRMAQVNIGLDCRLVEPGKRTAALALGETTLGKALAALAKEAGLGELVVEPGRRVWILAANQTARLLRTTGELPWDRARVRSAYIKELVDQFGVELIFDEIRKTVTPGEWDGDLPVAFYHAPTGRLIVIHDPDSQRQVAECIERLRAATQPKRPAEPKPPGRK